MQCLVNVLHSHFLLSIAILDTRSMFVKKKTIDLDVFDDVKLSMALILGKSKYADF